MADIQIPNVSLRGQWGILGAISDDVIDHKPLLSALL